MSRLDDFLKSTDDGVFLIGHASALVRTGQYLILFDPAWGPYEPYGSHWTFWPSQVNCDEILDMVDRIVLSHEHMDHLCEPILRLARCTVHIMSGRPRLKQRIEACGRTVVEHDPRQWKWFTPQSDIFFLEHPFNKVDSLPVIRGKNLTVSLGSDCFQDAQGCEILARACPPIDVALVPHQFIHWWPFLQVDISPEQRHEIIEREVMKCRSQAELFMRTIKPRIAFATGDSLFYAAGPRSLLNSHLFESSLPDGLLANRPGSYVLMKQDGPCIEFARTEEKFPEKKQEPLKIWPATLDPRRTSILKARLAMALPFEDPFDVVINDLPILADVLAFGTVRSGSPYYHFRFDIAVLNQWLDGKINLETAIGTRRFEFTRKPVDHYDPRFFEWVNKYL